MANRIEETGAIASARVVLPDDEVTLITAGGIALRTSVENIARSGRSTRGVRVIALQDGDTVASIARIEGSERVVASGDGAGGEAAAVSGNGRETPIEVS
jgi:DNA gyrase subunit A